MLRLYLHGSVHASASVCIASRGSSSRSSHSRLSGKAAASPNEDKDQDGRLLTLRAQLGNNSGTANNIRVGDLALLRIESSRCNFRREIVGERDVGCLCVRCCGDFAVELLVRLRERRGRIKEGQSPAQSVSPQPMQGMRGQPNAHKNAFSAPVKLVSQVKSSQVDMHRPASAPRLLIFQVSSRVKPFHITVSQCARSAHQQRGGP